MSPNSDRQSRDPNIDDFEDLFMNFYNFVKFTKIFSFFINKIGNHELLMK